MKDEWELLAHQVSILCDGWSERREYSVRVNYFTEMRVETITHLSLIQQLRNMTHPLVRAKSNDGGGGGGKPGSKPPGEFQSAALLDELRSYAHGIVEEWATHLAGRHLHRSLHSELRIMHQCSQVREAEEVREVSYHLARHIRQAKVILGHDAPSRAFDATVCGECGGQLRIAIDNVGGVFCAGSIYSGPCGTRYTHEDVIRLAMEAG